MFKVSDATYVRKPQSQHLLRVFEPLAYNGKMFQKHYCFLPFRVFTTLTLGQNLDDSLRPNPIPSSLSPPVSRVPFPPSLLPTLPSGVQCHEV